MAIGGGGDKKCNGLLTGDEWRLFQMSMIRSLVIWWLWVIVEGIVEFYC